MNETTQQEKTTQLSSRNEQLNSSVGTKQLNSALPSTACNRLQPPATAWNRLQPPATAYNRLQPPATAYNRLQPPTTTCNRLHLLYSRIGFFYLLTSFQLMNWSTIKPSTRHASKSFIHRHAASFRCIT
ncbi:hypothetical protein TNCV_2219271 [Trichonephila clavipes]|nr:hypothetical protein TNCV_2219271 [Trichonephila clavipes]